MFDGDGGGEVGREIIETRELCSFGFLRGIFEMAWGCV
jgi:hypothetical protein